MLGESPCIIKTCIINNNTIFIYMWTQVWVLETWQYKYIV